MLLDERDISERARRIGGGLAALGLREGDRVAALGANTAEYVALRDAATALGLFLVPVNPRLAPPEIAHVLGTSGARLVEPEALDGPPIAVPAAGGGVAPEAIGATILFTSGTTGRPKGCVRTAAQEAARARELVATYGLGPGDVHLVACPLAHSAPGIFLRACRAVGARTAILPRFEPRAFLDAVAAVRATVFFLVPTQIERLLALPEPARAAADLSSTRAWIVAGAPFSPATRRRLLDWIGPGKLWEFYGSSETGTVTVLAPDEQPDAPAGCVGRPPAGVELRLEPGGEDGLGEVFVRSPAVMQGYLDEPPLAPGAWMSVGDLGRLDERGRLLLLDRKHDTIITGGVNVYPAEVERALVEHPDVAGAVVCGTPDAEWGQVVAAVVAPRPGAALDEAALRAFLRERLAGFKLPKRFAFVTLDALPVGSSGKPLRRAAARLLG